MTYNTFWAKILASNTQTVPGFCLCLIYLFLPSRECLCQLPVSLVGALQGSLANPCSHHLPGEIAFLSLWNSLLTEGNELGLASPCC